MGIRAICQQKHVRLTGGILAGKITLAGALVAAEREWRAGASKRIARFVG